jgi:hypothetical protein
MQLQCMTDPAAAAAAAGHSQQQQEDLVQTFVVDASSCQVGNPLAHMLDYRALAKKLACWHV